MGGPPWKEGGLVSPTPGPRSTPGGRLSVPPWDPACGIVCVWKCLPETFWFQSDIWSGYNLEIAKGKERRTNKRLAGPDPNWHSGPADPYPFHQCKAKVQYSKCTYCPKYFKIINLTMLKRKNKTIIKQCTVIWHWLWLKYGSGLASN